LKNLVRTIAISAILLTASGLLMAFTMSETAFAAQGNGGSTGQSGAGHGSGIGSGGNSGAALVVALGSAAAASSVAVVAALLLIGRMFDIQPE
jgi:hypothetical protein